MVPEFPAPGRWRRRSTVTSALVTLRRPPHNLLTEPLLRRLADHIEALSGRCRVAVVASEGRSFCAGADFRSDAAPDPTAGTTFAATTAAFYAQALRIFDAPLPTRLRDTGWRDRGRVRPRPRVRSSRRWR